MTEQEKRYIRVVYPSLNQAGLIFDVESPDLQTVYQKVLQNNLPMYRSYYTFPVDILQYADSHGGSVAGYNGPAYVDDIILDVDARSVSLETARETVRKVVIRLVRDFKVPQYLIRVWFSGRGFHIQIPDLFAFNKEDPVEIPNIVKSTLTTIFPECDSVYDKNRLIRVGWSLNENVELRKIPISHQELLFLSEDTMKNLAKPGARQRNNWKWDPIPKDNRVDLSDRKIYPAVTKPEKEIRKPTKVVSCMQHAYNAGPVEGTRNETVMRMASAWRRAGVPQPAITVALKEWANLPANEVERAVQNVFDNALEYGCNDPIMSKWCDPQCIFYEKKNYTESGAVSAGIMEAKYADFVKTDFSKSAFNLTEIFDLPSSYMFYPGEFITTIGDTKIGKTALWQNIAVKLKRMNVLYISTEVGLPLLYRRFIQIAHGMSKKEVMEHYTTKTNSLSGAIKHIHALFVAPSIENIRKAIISTSPQLVIIDPIDDVVTGITEQILREEKIARSLKQLANEMGVIIVGIQHITKTAAVDPSGSRKALTIHSGKGSSAAEQKADKVIAIEGDRNNLIRRVHSLGARDETGFSLYVQLNPDTFTIHQIKEGTIGLNIGNG